MENLILSLNATLLILILMLLGVFFRKVGLMDGRFANQMNQFVFKAAFPVLLFEDLAGFDFFHVWDTRFMLFCFGATLAETLLVSCVSLLLKGKNLRGEFIQPCYRSSAALLGIAFAKNIYGNAGAAPLIIIGNVPLYNTIAVPILSFMRPGQENLPKGVLKDTLKGVCANPIILGILAGMIWSMMGLRQPAIMEKTVASPLTVAIPLELMAMGVSPDWKKVREAVRPALLATVMKLLVTTGALPLAVIWLGFRNGQLVAILVMLGSATTVSCFVMARNMGHEDVLTSSVVALTTCVSASTLTSWLYLIKSLSLI